jgi:hypothetical protein
VSLREERALQLFDQFLWADFQNNIKLSSFIKLER